MTTRSGPLIEKNELLESHLLSSRIPAQKPSKFPGGRSSRVCVVVGVGVGGGVSVTVDVTVTSLDPENVPFHVNVRVARRDPVLFGVMSLTDRVLLTSREGEFTVGVAGSVRVGSVGVCVLVWVNVRYETVVVCDTVNVALSSIDKVTPLPVRLRDCETVSVNVSVPDDEDERSEVKEDEDSPVTEALALGVSVSPAGS